MNVDESVLSPPPPTGSVRSRSLATALLSTVTPRSRRVTKVALGEARSQLPCSPSHAQHTLSSEDLVSLQRKVAFQAACRLLEEHAGGGPHSVHASYFTRDQCALHTLLLSLRAGIQGAIKLAPHLHHAGTQAKGAESSAAAQR